MGFNKVVHLYCNGNTAFCDCDGFEASEGDNLPSTIAEYKAKLSGWHYVHTKAYCPSCWRALKKAEKK